MELSVAPNPCHQMIYCRPRIAVRKIHRGQFLLSISAYYKMFHCLIYHLSFVIYHLGVAALHSILQSLYTPAGGGDAPDLAACFAVA